MILSLKIGFKSQLTFSKFIYLCNLYTYKVLLKSKFDTLRDSLVSQYSFIYDTDFLTKCYTYYKSIIIFNIFFTIS